MKKIIFILSIFSISCFGQTPIIDIKTWNTDIIPNMYLKDIDNNFNQFEGTWLYTNGNTSLKIILVKKLMQKRGRYFEDIIIGEYQYIENGVEKFNSLNDLNTIYPYMNRYKINGNWYRNYLLSPFNTVLPNETRLKLYFKDNLSGDIVIQRIMVSGQPALEILKRSGQIVSKITDPYIDALVPDGEYILIKQP